MDGGSEGGAEAEAKARTRPARTRGNSRGVGGAQKGRAVGGRNWRCDDVRMVVWRLLATRHGERAGRGGRRGRRVAAAGEKERGGRRGGLGWRSRRSADERGDSSQQPAANKRRQTPDEPAGPAQSPRLSLSLSHMSGVVTCSTLFAWRANVRPCCSHCRHSCQSSPRNPPASIARPPCLRCHGARSMQPQYTTWHFCPGCRCRSRR
jgi:hypothetical protein